MEGNMTVGGLKLLCQKIAHPNENDDYKTIITDVYITLLTRRKRPVSMKSFKLQSFYQPLENLYKHLFSLLDHYLSFLLWTYYRISRYETAYLAKFKDDVLIQEDHVIALRIYANETTAYSETQRIALSTALKSLYDLEIEKATYFFSLQQPRIYDYPQKTQKDKSHDLNHYFLMTKWEAWIKTNLLVMEREPQEMLPLTSFLDFTDALYLIYWRLFTEIKRDGNKVHYVYRMMSETAMALGFPGSKSLLEAGEDRTKKFSFINGTDTMRSYQLAHTMWNGTLGRGFYPKNLYKKLILNCLREMVPEIMELYVMMRRMCVFHLLFIFGTNMLPRRMADMLKGQVGLDFCKCLELLRRFRFLAINATETESDTRLESYCWTDVGEMIAEKEGFAEAFYHHRDLCMLKMLRELYVKNIVKAKNDFAVFSIRAAQIMSRLGYELEHLPEKPQKMIMTVFGGFTEIVEMNRRGILTCDNVEDRKLVKYVQYMNFLGLHKLHRIALTTLNQMDRRKTEVDFETVWMGLPMSEEIREMAVPLTKVDSVHGWCPLARKIDKFTRLDGSKTSVPLYRLPTEKSFVESDAIMNDEQFRSLFPKDFKIINPHM